mmetsp:Transcript_5702/g.14477  ORF Transcript_5702/g.14477 Transcript_5702/m.14477 type:complete len:395 (-) Transcript_5702:1057-2241(-)
MESSNQKANSSISSTASTMEMELKCRVSLCRRKKPSTVGFLTRQWQNIPCIASTVANLSPTLIITACVSAATSVLIWIPLHRFAPLPRLLYLLEIISPGLNTSIGSKNYKDFYRLMLAIALMQLIHIGVSTYLVVDIFTHGPTEARADDWLGTSGDNTSIAITAVLLFFMFFDAVSLILLAQLIVFHIKLQKKGLTTYQFIVQDAQRRREKAKLELELEQMRMTEVARAQEQGQNMEARRLVMGGKCRSIGCASCDPLDMPQPPPEPDPNQGFSSALGASNNGETEIPEQPGDAENGGAHNGVETNDNYHDENEAAHENGGNEAPATNGVGFIPVNGEVGEMSNERHDLDSQATQSELGDPDDVGVMTPTKSDALLGANPRDRDDEEEEVLPAV